MFRFNPHPPAFFILILLALAVFGQTADAQDPERFFDTASAPKENVRLTIFYPAPNTLRHIFALKAEGFIPFENLEIVGVYHVKERTNYRESVRYLQENKIEGVHFHAISADLDVASLFERTRPPTSSGRSSICPTGSSSSAARICPRPPTAKDGLPDDRRRSRSAITSSCR